MQQTHKALLVVSFGTSYHDAKEKSIDPIERDLAQALVQGCRQVGHPLF